MTEKQDRRNVLREKLFSKNGKNMQLGAELLGVA